MYTFLQSLKFESIKDKRYCKAVNGSIPWHSYGVSLAIWDYSVICYPIKWTHPALTPVEGWKAELS